MLCLNVTPSRGVPKMSDHEAHVHTHERRPATVTLSVRDYCAIIAIIVAVILPAAKWASFVSSKLTALEVVLQSVINGTIADHAERIKRLEDWKLEGK